MHLLRSAVRGEVHEEIRNRPLTGLDARLIHRVGGHAAARGPTEERRRSRHLQVVANLRRADRCVRKVDVEPMQEAQRVRLLAAVACGLYRLVDVREEGIPLLRLHVLEPQAVVAQVETQQTSPEARAGLAEAVRLRHIHTTWQVHQYMR